MRVEAGKYCITMGGQRVGPMAIGTWTDTCWVQGKSACDDAEWKLDGTVVMPGPEGYSDLLGTFIDTPASPTRTVTTTRTEIVPGVYGRLCVGVAPTHMKGNVAIRLADTAGQSGRDSAEHYLDADELTRLINDATAIRDALVEVA